MYDFWHVYAKPIYVEKSKLYYMDTDSFIVYIKRNNIYKEIAKDIETRFDTSIYKLDRHCLKKEIKK